MGYAKINGWNDMEYLVSVLTASVDNVPTVSEYNVLVPVENHNRVTSFVVQDTARNWIFEIANGDPSQAMDLWIIGGLPAQDPPQIVLPPGMTKITLAPGYAQRISYIVGSGFAPLFAGTLS